MSILVGNCSFSFSGKYAREAVLRRVTNIAIAQVFEGHNSPFVNFKSEVNTCHSMDGLTKRKDKKKKKGTTAVTGWLRAIGLENKCSDIPFQLRKTKTFLFFIQSFLFQNPNPYSGVPY